MYQVESLLITFELIEDALQRASELSKATGKSYKVSPVPLPQPPPVPTKDEKWKALRKKRNELLSACDWAMLGDAPLNAEQKAIMGNYRNKLRDLPETSNDPDKIVFPKEPVL